MNKISIGGKVPQFNLPATGDQTIKLSNCQSLRGRILFCIFIQKTVRLVAH
jgi:peroxiredoxin